MADEFVLAVPPGGGDKRLVPEHYIDNPAFGYKLPPSSKSGEATPVSYSTEQNKVYEPVLASTDEVVREPAVADTSGETVEEPAAATPKTTKRTAAGGEDKEASS